MAGLERILVLIMAAILGVVGMAHCLWPEEQAGPVFTPAPPASQPTQPSQPEVALPTVVGDTQLRIQAMAMYEGPYWEDGTGEHVSDVAALLLYNAGEAGIVYAELSLELDGKAYDFEFTYLPAGGRLLVPEKNRQPYTQAAVTGVHCGKLVTGDFGPDKSGIRLLQNGMAGIVLENPTQQELENVCLYYKLHLKGEDMYIGGTTYRMEAGRLCAGGSLEVVPEHFVWGYSAIVDIRGGEE